MNLSGCSKREVDIFSRTLSPKNRPTPFKSRLTQFESRPTQVLKNPDITNVNKKQKIFTLPEVSLIPRPFPLDRWRWERPGNEAS